MFGSFLPSLWSSSNHSLLGSRSRHCYAIKLPVSAANQELKLAHACFAARRAKGEASILLKTASAEETQNCSALVQNSQSYKRSSDLAFGPGVEHQVQFLACGA